MLIDLIGAESNQIPDTITNICFLCNTEKQKHDVIKDYILKNPEKKILIFADTKEEVK